MLMIAVFAVLLIAVVCKMIGLAVKMAWGITKCMLRLVFFPILLIAAVCKGFVLVAIGVLVIVGAVLLVRSLARI